jgi:hypothetical protein
MRKIRKWLQSIGLGQYADAFETNAIDMDLPVSWTLNKRWQPGTRSQQISRMANRSRTRSG